MLQSSASRSCMFLYSSEEYYLFSFWETDCKRKRKRKKINAILAHLLLSIQEFLPSIDRNLLESDSMIASPATRNSALLQSRTPFAHICCLRTGICANILNQENCNHAYVKGNIVLPLKIRRYRQRLLEILLSYQPICVLNSLPLGMNYH